MSTQTTLCIYDKFLYTLSRTLKLEFLYSPLKNQNNRTSNTCIKHSMLTIN